MEAPKPENAERKTLDDRQKMTDLERLRHSAAHVMATAIARLWPDAQFASGPAVENGFYYDVELEHRITPEDFPAIEAEMKKEIKANHVFEKLIVTREQAFADAQKGRLGALAERPAPSKFKIGNLADIPEGEPISYYKSGDFIDLCAGPHVMRTGNIGAYKLTTVASAYYKGDEKNPQLQRIYGTAFKNKTQLDEYFKMQEEAKRRDHRKIGAEMGLFVLDAEFVGPGMPLWLPKGTVLVEELEKLAKETEFAAGYVRVRTPHLAREKMYKTSGHLPYYAESMFPPMELDEMETEREELTSRLRQAELKVGEFVDGVMTKDSGKGGAIFEVSEDGSLQRSGPFLVKALDGLKRDYSIPPAVEAAADEFRRLKPKFDSLPPIDRYFLKAMNCPHHHRIFAAEPRSYRDLPLRLAEYGTCYRYEQSGELFGLMRVRSLNMNDAHIYCTEDQFASEFKAVNDMYLKYFKIFGLEKYQMRFSTHSKEGLGKKYVNEPELWLKTEDMVRRVLNESGINYVEVANEAAFYGPKIDVQVWSAIGREFTIATNQVDFAVPAKFGLTYRDRDNQDKTPLCIHRAPLGTHERFIGFLIEHYAGNFPLWLAPDQVRVLPVTDAQMDYAQGIVNELRGQQVRVELEFSNDKLMGRIQRAEERRVHHILVVGQREQEANNVALRIHGQGQQGVKPRAEVVAEILAAIRERKA
ncbi:MAG: threonine--tRNA ligase [Verrucomicrobia bacterium]|nr:threonine--tRNA ligase [Verrucomicrobiota bacterium]